MTQRSFTPIAAATIAAPLLASAASGQCVVYDFEQFSVGSPITTQYNGVTLSIVPQTCGSMQPTIMQPASGASSGTRAVGVPWGCPDFSEDYLRLVFDDPQAWVEFTVGTSVGGLVNIRSYSSGGGVIDNVLITTGTAANSLVRLGGVAFGGQIVRVEIESTIDDAEYMDDLSFGSGLDTIDASITEPTWGTCVCDGLFSVRGTACDVNGYAYDILETRPAGSPSDTPWTLLGNAAAPLCSEGTLYVVDTAGMPNGTHLLRLTVYNDCGASKSALSAISIDRSAPGVNVQRPAAGSTVCGETDFCGVIQDNCSIEWSIKLVSEDGSYLVAEGEANRCGLVTTFDMASIPEGDYSVEVFAIDDCGQASSQSFPITVAPGECAGSGPDLNGDGEVGFADLLILLSAWGA